ncbi:hypothetical protein [Streptococcus sp. E17BB]|uniref:hypothetical protein n=1 Tax=Streptococcus sp. E17BB TaxID=3278714 RepID=UPI00359EAD95
MRTNRLFWRFTAVLSLVFWGTLGNNPFLVGSGISLIMFWSLKKQINRRTLPANRRPYTIFLIALCAFLPLSYTEFFGALFGFTGLLWGGYAVSNQLSTRQQQKLSGQRVAALPTIDQIKSTVKQLDGSVSRLKALAESKQHAAYKASAPEVLTELEQLADQLNQQKNRLDLATFQRLMTRIATERQLIQDTLHQLQHDWESQLPDQHNIKQIAPEISAAVYQIRQDSQLIKEQIKKSQLANQAELLELHQTSMLRFNSILTGYLTIKEHPNHYYDAEKRLTTAQETIERFANDLKEQVRQLNENAMYEFEVNLRLLNSTV